MAWARPMPVRSTMPKEQARSGSPGCVQDGQVQLEQIVQEKIKKLREFENVHFWRNRREFDRLSNLGHWKGKLVAILAEPSLTAQYPELGITEFCARE